MNIIFIFILQLPILSYNNDCKILFDTNITCYYDMDDFTSKK